GSDNALNKLNDIQSQLIPQKQEKEPIGLIVLFAVIDKILALPLVELGPIAIEVFAFEATEGVNVAAATFFTRAAGEVANDVRELTHMDEYLEHGDEARNESINALDRGDVNEGIYQMEKARLYINEIKSYISEKLEPSEVKYYTEQLQKYINDVEELNALIVQDFVKMEQSQLQQLSNPTMRPNTLSAIDIFTVFQRRAMVPGMRGQPSVSRPSIRSPEIQEMWSIGGNVPKSQNKKRDGSNSDFGGVI
ncbi:288_t:CDS:1, partial [Racocetra fulgida]